MWDKKHARHVAINSHMKKCNIKLSSGCKFISNAVQYDMYKKYL